MDNNINIHIDRLVLDGIAIPGHRQPLLQRTVETELGRLLTAGGVEGEQITDVEIAHLSAGDIRLSGEEEHNPIALGRQIAQTVYEQKFLWGGNKYS